MIQKKNIFAIIGSASKNSANLKLVERIGALLETKFNITIYNELKSLPHFDPELSTDNPPSEIVEFRNAIQNADGVIICTPEYIFSIPSGLKNAIEWCIATTIFMNKPIGLITASADGQKGHEELQLIMKTAMAHFNEETILLIQGIKGKIDQNGNITNHETMEKINSFISSLTAIIK